MLFIAFAVLAGVVQPGAATAAPGRVAAAADQPAVEDPARPMPSDPYREWDGSAGVPDRGDPRLRQIVVDNAELAEEPEVREAAAAALAVGRSAAIMEFLDHGNAEAQARARARKDEIARRELAEVEALRGTGGPYLKAEVERVLAGSVYDRSDFLAFGKDIANQRDADAAKGEQELRDRARARVLMLTAAAGPAVQRAAQAALDAGDAAITEFLKSGYLVAAKADADTREQQLKDEEARIKAAEELSDLARRSARATQARRNLLVAHGNGVRALEKSANALVLAGNEARTAAQILAANTAGGKHPADAFDRQKNEVARQLGYARQAGEDAQRASASAQVQANILVETGLTYGVQWAQMATGMANAAQAAVSASETAAHTIDATAFTDQARNAQEQAERHAAEAHQWRLHAEEHAKAAARLADAARVQADAAKDAAARTKAARQAAESAEAQAWAAAERTRTARVTAEREAANAAAARQKAERERAAAAAARSRADQQAAVAHSARAEATRQAGIAAGARGAADAANGRAADAETRARGEERNAADARDHAYQAERDQRAAEARAAAMDSMAAAARGGQNQKPAQDAADEARGAAGVARNAAGAARGAANTATGAAAGARAAATEAGAHAARARAAAQQAAAAAARANAAANRAEAEAAATHAARLKADAAASDATFSEAQAAEAARNAMALAERASDEAIQAARSAERTKAEADAAAAESVSAATQAGLAVKAASAAKNSSTAITDPANTAITVVAPFSGGDLDADFVVLVANQAKAIGAEQAAAAQQRATEALDAARRAQDAADRAAGEVKPAFDASAAAAHSSAAAAKSAAEAQKAAADAAVDGAAARAAAARSHDADAQARADAVKARAAANAASNDAAIAGKAASAAERDAAAARAAANRAESDAAAARGAASRAESDATAAEKAAAEAQTHADNTAQAARDALQHAIDAGHAADRAEQAERERKAAERAKQVQRLDDAGPDPTGEDIDALFSDGGEELVNRYLAAREQTKKGIIDYLVQNGGQTLLDLIGYTDAKRCFGEGDVAACLWTVLNVGTLISMAGKVPEVVAAIAKVGGGLTKFLDEAKTGQKFLEQMRGVVTAAEARCPSVPNSFSPATPVLLADGSHRPIKDVKAGDAVITTDPITGRTGTRPVSAVIVGSGRKDLVDVTADNGATIHATAGHPFWVENRRLWAPADHLRIGDRLHDRKDRPVTVSALRSYEEEKVVYNLSVEEMHTYYVEAGGRDVLVHNLACLEVLKNFANKQMQFGREQFLLDKKGMDHFLIRHHPKYWDGSVKENQSFFRESMTIDELQSTIERVLAQNRDTLISKGTGGMYQIEGTVDGITYTVGLNNGRIGQFYPH
ncbi:polymorphic toxin-type HINT domain-containing protein [Amycolatopsis sulphurea]|uniref:polymorphic toxin-type HINT domain-containing protein n=1 Tax=Amycolatopsis sulphurea TaxID=76022 RepID=UPI000BF9E644|nr:polymorphic toxin-type HINT domain-containing protein [Amycolatopsis sulphurea]